MYVLQSGTIEYITIEGNFLNPGTDGSPVQDIKRKDSKK
jgi:hypothetical protein